MNAISVASKAVSERRTIAVLTTLLVISAGLNVGLTYRLRQFLDMQEAQLERLEARRLKAGTAVPSLDLQKVGADVVETISYADVSRPTVLYVLSPACGWCARNENSVRQLVATKGDEYRFIGVSLMDEGVKEYAAAHDLDIPLYTGISEEAKKAYKMGGTPQTIVVSPKGVVLANWNGAYLGKQKEAVEDFFKVRLPEIELKGQAPH